MEKDDINGNNIINWSDVKNENKVLNRKWCDKDRMALISRHGIFLVFTAKNENCFHSIIFGASTYNISGIYMFGRTYNENNIQYM